MALAVAASLDGSGIDPCCCSGPCGLECQYKSGFGQLGGFPEYIPSSPPKFYRTKTLAGAMAVTRFNNPGCNDASTPVGGVLLAPTFNWEYEGILQTSDASAGWSLVAPMTLRIAMGASSSLGSPHGSVMISPNNAGASAGYAISGGLSVDLDLNYYTAPSTWPIQITVTAGRDFYGYAGGDPAGPRTMVVSLNLKTTIVDDYDLTQRYLQVSEPGAATILVLQEPVDHSIRTVDGAAAGTVDAGDYAGLTTEGVTATTRTITGTGVCVNAPRWAGDPFPYCKATGTVTETLTEQDTLADAVARAEAGISGWSTCLLGCGATCTAFRIQADATVAFRSVQVRLKAGPPLAANTTYRAIISYFERPIGTGAPFSPAGSTEDTFNSGSSPYYYTSWVDLAEQDNVETMAGRCAVVLAS